jgi:peptidoglycan hydrolase-like protein with peptidoglycan-binding domain
LNDRGVKVTPDGLYGPKTASAWQKLAKSKGLPTTISREGPKVAKVATQAIETLAVPPIP